MAGKQDDEAARAAMRAELGQYRVDEFPLEDRHDRKGPTYRPSNRVRVIQDPTTVALATMYRNAIQAGQFEDSDAAAVKGLDSLGGARIYDTTGKKQPIVPPHLRPRTAQNNVGEGIRREAVSSTRLNTGSGHHGGTFQAKPMPPGISLQPGQVHRAPSVAPQPAAVHSTPCAVPQAEAVKSLANAARKTAVSMASQSGQLPMVHRDTSSVKAAKPAGPPKKKIYTDACWDPSKSTSGTMRNVFLTLVSTEDDTKHEPFFELELEPGGKREVHSLWNFDCVFRNNAHGIFSFFDSQEAFSSVKRTTFSLEFDTDQKCVDFIASLDGIRTAAKMANEDSKKRAKFTASSKGRETAANTNYGTMPSHDKASANEIGIGGCKSTDRQSSNGAASSSQSPKEQMAPNGAASVHSGVYDAKATVSKQESENKHIISGDNIAFAHTNTNASVPTMELFSANGVSAVAQMTSSLPDNEVNTTSEVSGLEEKANLIVSAWATISDVILEDDTSEAVRVGLQENLLGAAAKKQANREEDIPLLMNLVKEKLARGSDKSSGKSTRITYTAADIAKLRDNASPRPSVLDKATFLPSLKSTIQPGGKGKGRQAPGKPDEAYAGQVEQQQCDRRLALALAEEERVALENKDRELAEQMAQKEATDGPPSTPSGSDIATGIQRQVSQYRDWVFANRKDGNCGNDSN